MAARDRHPPILIAISWQALNRALAGDPRTRECDCAVVFAGFYLEADLNDLIRRLGRQGDMLTFLDRSRRNPGLQDRLAWFCNEYVARSKAKNRDELYRRGIKAKLRQRAKDVSRALVEIAGAHGHALKPSADCDGAIGLGSKKQPPHNGIQPAAPTIMSTAALPWRSAEGA
jgi:hypothetical protein